MLKIGRPSLFLKNETVLPIPESFKAVYTPHNGSALPENENRTSALHFGL
jgi:hypothetical protein